MVGAEQCAFNWSVTNGQVIYFQHGLSRQKSRLKPHSGGGGAVVTGCSIRPRRMPRSCATCDIVEDQCWGCASAFEIEAKKSFFYFFLAAAEIVEGIVEIFFIELAQTEHFGNGMILSPTNSGQARALMGDASQDQKQGEFAQFGLSEDRGKANVGSDLLEGMECAEDKAGSGIR